MGGHLQLPDDIAGQRHLQPRTCSKGLAAAGERVVPSCRHEAAHVLQWSCGSRCCPWCACVLAVRRPADARCGRRCSSHAQPMVSAYVWNSASSPVAEVCGVVSTRVECSDGACCAASAAQQWLLRSEGLAWWRLQVLLW